MPAPAPSRILRCARNALCFLLALVAPGAVLNHRTPIPVLDQITDKFDMYRAGAGSYDVLFFGSSKIYTGFDPRLFDEELASRGHELRTLNFGVDSMSFPESAYICEQVLAQFPFKPRYIMLEVTGVRWRIPPWQRGSRRILYWHDAKRTAQIERALVEDVRSWREFNTATALTGNATPAQLILDHALLFARRSVCLGDGAQLWPPWLQPAQPDDPPPVRRARDHPDPALRGYFPLEIELPPSVLPEYQQSLKRFADPKPEPRSETAERAFLEFEEKVHAAGAKLILVVFPNNIPNRRIFYTNEGRPAPEMWSFDNPTAHPELYLPAHRESVVHLNAKGTPLFTAKLAARFADWLSAHPKN